MTEKDFLFLVATCDVDPLCLETCRQWLDAQERDYDPADLLEAARDMEANEWW